LTGKWSGSGHGSAEKNAEDMAKILAGIGITDIKQFGKFTKTGINETVTPDGKGGFVDQNGKAVDPSIVTSQMAGESEGGYYTEYLAPIGSQEVFGNKVTKQEVPLTYSGRQTGNFFGGTYAGKGNTGYGVQFDSQGNPIFYTQGASSNTLANLMKDMGPLGQIAIAAATGGMSLPAQLATKAAVQLLAGADFKDIAKGTALSYLGLDKSSILNTLGGAAGNLISGSSGITDLLGKTGTDIASRAAQQFIGSGGDLDVKKSLLSGAVGSGVNSVIGDIPGLDNLSPIDRNMTSNLISAIATGTPVDQAIQNALVGKASYEASNAVAQARNAPPSSVDQPQTYEDMMAGIMPKTPDQPSTDTGPSNDEILKQIGYDPEPTTVQQEPANLDQLLRSLQPYAEPTLEGRTLPQERTQITQDPSEAQVSFNIDDLLKQLPTDNEKPPVDNLINQAVTDTLGTKNAAEPATAKGKTMDDIDLSSLMGSLDAGPGAVDLSNIDLSNLLAANTPVSNFDYGGGDDFDISSILGGVGREIDFSKITGDDGKSLGIDTTGLDAGDTFDLSALTSSAGDKGQNNQGYYDEITGEFVQNQLGGLLNPLDAKAGDSGQGYYNEITGEFVQNPLGALSGPLDNDVGNLDPDSKWEYSLKKPGVWVNDKGQEIDLSYLPNTQKTMTGAQIMKKAGATAGGARTATTAKKTTKPAASGGNNANMIMALMAMMAMMNSKGSGGGSGAGSVIPALQANRSQLPYSPSSRPGAGGKNYFTPTTYTAKAAEGGLMGLAGGGMSHLGGYSDGGRLLRGPGDGVSDSIPATIGGKQPARLAEGEFVVPARIVSELGNGSTNAGAKKLYAMMDRVQNKRRKTKNVAADTKAHKNLPA
jgi:hypothetical protein